MFEGVTSAARRVAVQFAPALEGRLREVYGAAWLKAVNNRRRSAGLPPGRGLHDHRFTLAVLGYDPATDRWVDERWRELARELNGLANKAAHDEALAPREVDRAVEIAGLFGAYFHSASKGEQSASTPEPCQRAALLFAQQRWPEALVAFRECVQHDPSNRRAWMDMWIASTRCTDRLAGLEATMGWTSAVPDEPLAWLANARESVIAEKFEGAVMAAEHYLAMVPDEDRDQRVFADYGTALALTNRLDRVATIIDKWPDTPSLFVTTVKAQVMSRLGRHEEAVEIATRMTVLDPSVPQAWRALARSLHELGRHDEEVDAAKRCVELVPGDIAALKHYAAALAETQQWERVVAELNKGCAENDPDASVLEMKAKALRVLQRDAEAVAVAAAALEISKSEELFGGGASENQPLMDAWEVQAWCMYRIGQFDGAAAAAQQLLRQEPENPYFLFLLHRALRDAKRHDEALDAAERWIKSDPSAPAWAAKAATLLDLRRYDDALRGAELVVSLHPDDPNAFDLMVMACLGSHDPRAIRYAERWVEVAPESDDAREVLDMLRAKAASSE